MINLCTINECSNTAYCKTLCKKCYHRLYSQKNREEITSDPKKKCAVEDCTKRKYAKGYCSAHYFVLKTNAKATELSKCKIPDCTLRHYAKGFCAKHYRNSVSNNERPSSRYSQAKFKSRKSGTEWSLPFQEYCELISKNCYYCNGSLSPTGTGLDRLNNKRGYSTDNVVPCCGDCNYLRGIRLSESEMLEIVKLLQKLRNNPNIWK